MIDIDSLTIGEARKLAALFGGAVAPTPASDTPPRHAGDVVLLRTYAAGVWIGIKVAERNGGSSVALTDARRIWSWVGAGDCSELSLVGPRKGGRIGPSVAVEVHGVIEEYKAADACIAAVKAVPPWSE